MWLSPRLICEYLEDNPCLASILTLVCSGVGFADAILALNPAMSVFLNIADCFCDLLRPVSAGPCQCESPATSDLIWQLGGCALDVAQIAGQLGNIGRILDIMDTLYDELTSGNIPGVGGLLCGVTGTPIHCGVIDSAPSDTMAAAC